MFNAACVIYSAGHASPPPTHPLQNMKFICSLQISRKCRLGLNVGFPALKKLYFIFYGLIFLHKLYICMYRFPPFYQSTFDWSTAFEEEMNFSFSDSYSQRNGNVIAKIENLKVSSWQCNNYSRFRYNLTYFLDRGKSTFLSYFQCSKICKLSEKAIFLKSVFYVVTCIYLHLFSKTFSVRNFAIF